MTDALGVGMLDSLTIRFGAVAAPNARQPP
jgi:hypothetical protein